MHSRPPPPSSPTCLVQAASWALLACVMKGFAVSVVSPPAAPPPSLTTEQLVTYLAPKLNAARDLRAKIFGCSDPRLALCAPQVETTGMKTRILASLRFAPPLARLQQSRLALPCFPPASTTTAKCESRIPSQARRARALRGDAHLGACRHAHVALDRRQPGVRAARGAQGGGASQGLHRTLLCSLGLGRTLCLSPRLDPRPGHSVLRAFAGGPRCWEQSGSSDGAPEGGRACRDATGAPALRQGSRLAAAGGHPESADRRRQVRWRRTLLPPLLRCTSCCPPLPRPPPHPPRPSYSLLWFFCLSWMHKVLAAGFVCLHLKAQGHISPTTEMQACRTCIDTCIGTPPLPSRPRCSSTISFPSRFRRCRHHVDHHLRTHFPPGG